MDNFFKILEDINRKPKPFEFYTASELWTDDHTSKQMLTFHLNGEINVSSRKTTIIEQSVNWIISHFCLKKGMKVADFGCGPGLYSQRLALHGLNVTGIDFSKRSIQYAQEAASQCNLDIQYVNQNYLQFESDDQYNLIMMIMCDFCALSPSQRKDLLKIFHTHLETGGALLLDVYSLNAFKNRNEAASYEANLLDGFWAANKYYGFLNTFKYEDEKVVLDKHSVIETNRIRTVYNWLQYFEPETLKEELQELGFKVESLYSDVTGNPYDPKGDEFAVIAKKV